MFKIYDGEKEFCPFCTASKGEIAIVLSLIAFFIATFPG